jgi:hypothetical protein
MARLCGKYIVFNKNTLFSSFNYSIMIVSNNSYSHQELYVGCQLGWNLFEDYLTEFGEFKGKYTVPFVSARRTEIDAAEALLDADARYADLESMRQDLALSRDNVIHVHGFLLSYIDDAFDKSKRDFNYKAAGQNYVSECNNRKWTSVKALLSSADEFIETNKAALLANENMPADFQERFRTVKNEFDNVYRNYLALETQCTALTAAKIEANNAIYDAVRNMTIDAKRLFRIQESVANKFLLTNIFSQTRNTRNCGIKGKVTIDGKKGYVKNVLVSINNGEKTTFTDESGRFDFPNLPAGKYKLTFTKDGFSTIVVNDYVVKLGIVSRPNQILKALGEAVAVAQGA